MGHIADASRSRQFPDIYHAPQNVVTSMSSFLSCTSDARAFIGFAVGIESAGPDFSSQADAARHFICSGKLRRFLLFAVLNNFVSLSIMIANQHHIAFLVMR